MQLAQQLAQRSQLFHVDHKQQELVRPDACSRNDTPMQLHSINPTQSLSSSLSKLGLIGFYESRAAAGGPGSLQIQPVFIGLAKATALCPIQPGSARPAWISIALACSLQVVWACSRLARLVTCIALVVAICV